MMTSSAVPVSLAFRFPAGRYHATPYGHHVNEGLIEWPPSPWRILRALISVGYTSGCWNSTLPTVARSLIEKLSAELPHYRIPPTVGAHSRHYMPVGVLDSKTKIEKTTLVFDTWARVEAQELLIIWANTSLDENELSTLSTLVERLNYLGRSESWVEGRVMQEDEPILESNCFPEQLGKMPGPGWEQIPLLAALSSSDFLAWREEQLSKALADLQIPDGRKPPKTLLSKREKAIAPYPDDLLDCLQKDTTWWRFRHGWSQPPGSQRIFYWRPSDAISVGAPRAKRAAQHGRRVKAVLLSLTNASRNEHALPLVTRILPEAELLHRAIVSNAGRHGTPPPELTGRDEHRRPLGGPHQHAHINPLDLDGDGHLDHILIWAPMGLGAESQTAVRSTRKTYMKGGLEPLHLAVAATGDLNDLTHLQEKYGRSIASITGHASSWQSVTPFVPPRYVKARGKSTLEGQIRAELHSRGLPEPTAVYQPTPVPRGRRDTLPTKQAAGGGEPIWSRFRHFKIVRHRGSEPPLAFGFAIRLDFEYPIPGPIALGYGSHFGLGLFEQIPADTIRKVADRNT